MNSTTPATNHDDSPSPQDLMTTLSAAFYGFSIGAILFGITVRQAYQYYAHVKDSIIRRIIIGAVCVLDSLNMAFSMYLVFSLVLELLGNEQAGAHVVWSLKALATTQVFLILLVQGFYLFQMWKFSGNSLLLQRRFTLASQIFVIVIAIFAIAVAVVFMSQLQRVNVVFGFSGGFEYVMYLGFGATAIVDCSIAAAMCVILYKSSSGVSTGLARSESVLESLIQYFVGTGLLTSFASILVIILYVAQPHTLLYMGMEFSVTRLYANSILAMFNARQSLNEKMNQTIELKLPSNMFFSDGDSMTHKSLIGNSFQDPFSPNSDTKYSPAAESVKFSPGEDSYGFESCHIRGRREENRSSVPYTL